MIRWIGLAVASAVIAGCAGMMAGGPSATATLDPTQGNNTRGTVDFVQKGDKVAFTAKMSGLPPGGHGFHIHEKGDCSSGDGMSAGGHFNPLSRTRTDRPTAIPATADADGRPRGSRLRTGELDAISMARAADIVGKAVIVQRTRRFQDATHRHPAHASRAADPQELMRRSRPAHRRRVAAASSAAIR
jgi:Cu-Zn family superoxide dismutase